ncbi:MAG: hypothetical protein JSS99_16530 [Actinobacteria bacterium]|nr:hypothetical protein [Actinomycetota bacterium]
MLFTHRFVQHRIRAIVALLALATVALVLAACGGDSSGGSGSSSDATTLLRQTFTGTHNVRSGKANVQLRVNVSGDSSVRGPIQLTVAGPFESAGANQMPKFDLALDANAQGQGFRAGITSTSDALYVNFGGTAYKVPAQLLDRLKASYRRAQQKGSSSRSQMSLGSLGLDPLSWLKDPTVEGTETVGGVATDHISAQLNVSALLDDVDKILARVSAQGLPTGQSVPSSIPAKDRRQIEDAVKSASVDVWSGKSDHTLRRLHLALHVDVPRRSTSVDLALTIELTDLNQPQTIAAPTASRPLNELLGQLQGFLGGALGGSGALGGGSGSSGGASSQQLQAYSDCIQRAGSNVTEAQKCADLLTK